MYSHTVTGILGDCYRCVGEAAATEGSSAVEALKEFAKCREVLSQELQILLQEAADMKWPFVPEKWQYKNSLTLKDKVNLKDLISENLSQLLAYLKAAILAGQTLWAASAIFLVDRFLYWTDDSRQLLRIARKLHQRNPGTPIAPQVVIRQARVYFSTGKLQKAEYILGNLISTSGSTGCWRYHTESDRTLVQAVSVQVRGQVLQKLGLWFEAAELICASLVGFYALPQPDKKGIGTSLGILANILVSMDDKDFRRFRKNEDTYSTFLGKTKHRLLSAAEAAKMAVIYSQYASLYVLTNVVTQGTCLLSYSFSTHCPPSDKTTYLTLAKEAFEIGLLTKTKEDVVTSKQELHTFVKAAYALAITHKWLGSHYGLVAEATKVCREASKIYYTYCFKEGVDREKLCGEIMGLVQEVKSLLKVEPYVNSDPGSFIPDAYRASKERTVVFTLEDFNRVMGKFQQHHKSVCEASKVSCHRHVTEGSVTSSGVCVTSFGTATEIATTECTTESDGDSLALGSSAASIAKPRGDNKNKSRGDEDNINPQLTSPAKPGVQCNNSFRPPLSRQRTPKSIPDQSSIETEEEETDMENSNICAPKRIPKEKCSSSSLGSSFGSLSSWQKEPSLDSELSNDDVHGHPILPGKVIPTRNDPRAEKSNTDNNILTPIKTIPDQSSIETEDDLDFVNLPSQAPLNFKGATKGNKERSCSSSLSSSFGSLSSLQKIQSAETEEEEPDQMNANHASQGPSGSSQGNKLVSLSSSLSSSFGTSSSWQKVPSLDTGSFKSDSGLTGGCEGIPVKTNIEGTPGKLHEVTKSPFPSVRPNTKPDYGGPQKSSMDLAETEPDILDPLSKPVLTQDIAELKIGNCSNNTCKKCFAPHPPEMGVLNDILTGRDYSALLAGVCHECLMDRLPKKSTPPVPQNEAYGALLLKFSKSTGLWTGRETNIYIGKYLQKGKQRKAYQVQFLHQEELLGSYVGKQYYYRPDVTIHDHLNDVERQMTAQHYVTEFNKRLYEKNITAQIFFIPSEVLLVLEGDAIIGCVTAEPYILGTFSRLTNNKNSVNKTYKTSEYGIAFGHFTYEYSGCKEVVVDLQGWVTEDGKGLTYLTDPQIHTLLKPRKTSNFHQRGINLFLEEQHGPECNEVCELLCLGKLQMPKAI